LVIQQLRPLSFDGFGYNAESVGWLEGYIERLRESGTSGYPLYSSCISAKLSA
jgi:hypothetical protein